MANGQLQIGGQGGGEAVNTPVMQLSMRDLRASRFFKRHCVVYRKEACKPPTPSASKAGVTSSNCSAHAVHARLPAKVNVGLQVVRGNVHVQLRILVGLQQK